MSTTTEAQAPHQANNESNISTGLPAMETSPAALEPDLTALDPQAQHEQLAQMLSNPEWAPDVATPDQTELAGDLSGETTAIASADKAPSSEDHEEAENESESKDRGKRFRFTDPADRQFAVLRKEGIAPDEAARIAYGIGASQIAASPAAEAATVDPLSAWQHELRQVDERLIAAGANEGLINGEIVALIQKRSDLAAEIRSETRLQEREARARATQEAEAAAQARAAQGEALAVVTQRFPHLTAPGTALRQEADRLLHLYRGSAFLEEAEAPFMLVEMAAANVAKAQAAANGTSFADEFGKLDRSVAAARGATSSAKAQGVRSGVMRRITPASGAQATLRPDQPATEADHYREAQSTLDPWAQHEALSRLLYGA